MTVVRPTLAVLKALDKKDMLPRRVGDCLKRVRTLEDPSERVRLLADLDLSSLDIPLVRDGANLFASGRPSIHQEMTAAGKCPVYEARDRTGAGWRGAVLNPIDDIAWLVYVDAHDRFHDSGADSIAKMRTSGTLGPSKLDLRLLTQEQKRREVKKDRATLLGALLDALEKTARTNAEIPVEVTGFFAPARITLHLSSSLDPNWDVPTSHEETSDLVVRLSLVNTIPNGVRDDILRTCVPFLQPDQTLCETYFRKDLVVQVVLTRAGLIQLLSTDRPLEPVENRTPPPPVALHYTAKSSLVEAYVEGRAVRAVCGQWWVPVGDSSTHPELPVCSECEAQEPFAEAALRILKNLTSRG
jgi:hypothetical protein